MHDGTYDPFAAGPHHVATETFLAHDAERDVSFPCDVWHPADRAPAAPFVIYSHHSGGHRRVATYLTTHLASHGFTVAAMDHAEVVSARLQRRDGESAGERAARVRAWIENRVPDVRLLLATLLEQTDTAADLATVGIVGHSFGGWTALAAADADARIGAVVALAPAGNATPRPGIIPVRATFRSGRDVPALFVAGDEDSSTPLTGVRELFDESPWSRRLAVLHGVDHLHYVDDVAAAHEEMRSLAAEGDLAWIAEMRPLAELADPARVHTTVAALSLAHFDAELRQVDEARSLLEQGTAGALGHATGVLAGLEARPSSVR